MVVVEERAWCERCEVRGVRWMQRGGRKKECGVRGGEVRPEAARAGCWSCVRVHTRLVLLLTWIDLAASPIIVFRPVSVTKASHSPVWWWRSGRGQ